MLEICIDKQKYILDSSIQNIKTYTKIDVLKVIKQKERRNKQKLHKLGNCK